MTSVSFEVFPPADPDGLGALRRTAEALATAAPTYVSVTYGAGGSQRDRSFASIETVGTTGVPVTAHLTCVGQSRRDVATVLDRYGRLGIERVVALRGDPPAGIDAPYEPHPDGFGNTADLVAAAAARGMRVAVSAYPERHPQSPSFAHDLDVLAEKVDAGADEAISQMFFDNRAFLRLRELIARHGVDVSLVAGIFPIHSLTAVQRFAARCGATIPTAIEERFAAAGDDPELARTIAVEVAAEQIAGLRAEGVDRFHLYTLNRSQLALEVCDRVGLLEPALG